MLGRLDWSRVGVLGVMGTKRKNRNRGYQRLRVCEVLDQLAFKLENGLLRLVEALERKRDTGVWTDTLIVQESNAVYLGTKTGNA